MKPPKHWVVCVKCGKQFLVDNRNIHYNSNSRRYTCHNCYLKPYQRRCVKCGKSFLVNNIAAPRFMPCQDCYNKPFQRTCVNCHKKFLVNNSMAPMNISCDKCLKKQEKRIRVKNRVDIIMKAIEKRLSWMMVGGIFQLVVGFIALAILFKTNGFIKNYHISIFTFTLFFNGLITIFKVYLKKIELMSYISYIVTSVVCFLLLRHGSGFIIAGGIYGLCGVLGLYRNIVKNEQDNND